MALTNIILINIYNNNHCFNICFHRALLTSDLPTLQPSQSGQGSDDDQLSTTDMDESAAGSLDDLHEREASATASSGTPSATSSADGKGHRQTQWKHVKFDCSNPTSMDRPCE